jgi:diguanylate cyclase (GGDEF)-like protein
MTSIKTKLVSLNLVIAAVITAMLGLFLWFTADLGGDIDRTRIALSQVEAALTDLDDRVLETTLALWDQSSATDGFALRTRTETAEDQARVLREAVAVLKASLGDAAAEQLMDRAVLLQESVEEQAKARRLLLEVYRVRGKNVFQLGDMLGARLGEAAAAAFMADLAGILAEKPGAAERGPELVGRCATQVGDAGAPPCRLLREILDQPLSPREAEIALRTTVLRTGARLRDFRAALEGPRTALEADRSDALERWHGRLALMTMGMTMALVIALPLFFLSQWIQEVLILRRIDGMRRSMADWLKGRAPVIITRGEDELDQMESYLKRFQETIERRDAVLRTTAEGLERARENLRTLLATAPTGILLADLSTRAVLESNQTAQRLLGLEASDRPLEHLLETLLTESPWSEVLARVASGDRVENAEITLPPVKDGGEPSWLLVSARAVPFDGQLRALVGLADISRQKELEAELRERAIRDPLTGLFNRRHFEAQALQALKRARRDGGPVSLVMSDIDHFKSINDTHGHVNGDRALRRLAEIIRATIREADTPGRLGGEEFGLLLPGVDRDGARVLAERLRKATEETVLRLPHDKILSMTVSLGVAQAHPDDTLESLVTRADTALYAAKNGGRNRVVMANPDHPADAPS